MTQRGRPGRGFATRLVDVYVSPWAVSVGGFGCSLFARAVPAPFAHFLWRSKGGRYQVSLSNNSGHVIEFDGTRSEGWDNIAGVIGLYGERPPW